MRIKNFKPLALLLVLIAGLYSIHKTIFYFQNYKLNAIQFYSLEKLYLYFSLFSVIIILILIKIKQKNLDQVGLTFMLLTSIKMGFAFWIAKPIFRNNLENLAFEKWNFLALFLLFLTIETIVTVKMLYSKID